MTRPGSGFGAWLWERCDLPHVSLVAVLAWTAHAHWMLAGVLDAPGVLRPLLPVAIDVYVLAALANRRDRAVALPLNGLAVAGAHAVHMAEKTRWWAEQVVAPAGGFAWLPSALAAAWGVILVTVMWRVHEVAPLKRHRQGQGRVKPQVSPPMAPVVTPPVEPARLHSVTSTPDPAPDPAGDPIVAQVEWVREQRAAGVRRADVIRAGVTRWGVSESTMIRRWEAAA